jgi:hypothetical protein
MRALGAPADPHRSAHAASEKRPDRRAEARAALRAFIAVGEIDHWIADQRWEPIPGGWRVRERYQGWHFRLEPAAGGLRVVMSARGGEPAAWTVPCRPQL